MRYLRPWRLEANSPYTPHLAADMRLAATDFVDDQNWELMLGEGENPALALQTRYGSRVGLASLVPMWWCAGKTIYQALTYSQPPVIVAFAPGYAQAQAQLTPELTLTADYWVMESHAVGGRFIVQNTGNREVSLRLDLFGYVTEKEKRHSLAIITLADETQALSMGKVTELEPVVVLENGHAELPQSGKTSPKIGVEWTIPAGGIVSARWTHAGMNMMSASLERAQFWLKQDWNAALAQVEQAAQAIPIIETGNTDHDAVITFSYQQLIQSFLDPIGNLPYASFVTPRHPDHGFSPRGDGSDYGRGWSGQTPHLSYLTTLGMVSIAPELAKGIVRNYLAIQAQDGGIDFEVGFAGQRQDFLCPPLLARLVWELYQYTGDKKFLEETFPKLQAFFNQWLAQNLTADGNILPKWQDEKQTGYPFWPTFGKWQPWAQNANIAYVAAPDAAAYMLSEAISLREIANQLDAPSAAELQQQISQLQDCLNRLWSDSDARYVYRDRDTNKTTSPTTIIEAGRGDEEQLPVIKLDSPSRLIVRVSGGTGKPPLAAFQLEGLNQNGVIVKENLDLIEFVWSYGQGVYTSQQIYTRVDRVNFTGLSRVYRVNVTTIDLTRLDINAVLPLWSRGIPPGKAELLIKLLSAESHFWRPGGLTIVSARDPNFDPAGSNGGGGVWTYWTTLIGEGLLEYGRGDLAAEMVKRLLTTQAEVLRQKKQFSEFYHSEKPEGLGELGYLGGIAPLHLLWRIFGIQIIDGGHVRITGKFSWKSTVTIRQHGVTVRRSKKGTQIKFSSGRVVKLSAEVDPQIVTDPTAVGIKPTATAKTIPPAPESSRITKRTIITVERDIEDEQS